MASEAIEMESRFDRGDSIEYRETAHRSSSIYQVGQVSILVLV